MADEQNPKNSPSEEIERPLKGLTEESTSVTEEAGKTDFEAPHLGSKSMPRWETGELIDAPTFTWRHWFALLGPGLLMGGSSIGGGEWLVGPIVTAKYGGAMLWLATLSVLGQVLYNIEVSRYTLYSGEPIFTGKFRTLPGPMLWVFIYLFLDFGMVFPYLAANAATPAATVILGEVPNAESGVAQFGSIELSHKSLLRMLGYAIFVAAMIPLIFGGKIYNVLKVIMAFKIVVVLGFLLLLGLFCTKWSTWGEIFSGFVQFGNVPIRSVEDLNGNGQLDAGEDWDDDRHLDVMEPTLALQFGTIFRPPNATDVDQDKEPDTMVNIGREEDPVWWPDLDGNGVPDESLTLDMTGDGQPDGTFQLERGDGGKKILYRNENDQLVNFVDVDNDGTRDGDRVANLITAPQRPNIDWTMISFLSALVAISGAGGLSNTTVSNYTRDQGWGMGHHVGAIPSVVGARDIQLSHVGTVFQPTEASLPRWRRWYRHVLRDQLVVWMPACFFGLALPSMLSVEFLPRGTEADSWTAAAMTAGAVGERVGGSLGSFCWFMTLFCGFLVLAPSMATAIDGVIRRWVDAFWTTIPFLRRFEPQNIRYVYFCVLIVYACFGLTMLSLEKPTALLTIAAAIFNFALGASCWHALAVNMTLLPRELRPNWLIRIGLLLAGGFFWMTATLAALSKLGII